MSRRWLVELEDQPWLPATLRDGMTDALRVLFSLQVRRTPIARRLGDLLAACDEEHILDLCSGGSGALVPVVEDLVRAGRTPRVLLTDKFPNLPALRALCAREGDRFAVREEPLDATRVPAELPGVRTLFAAFHHFAPEPARAILASAARAGRGIAVFEVTERRLTNLLAMPLVGLFVLGATPFLRPFRWRRLALTYLLPLLPLLVLWDGLVSCWHSYSADALRDLVAKVDVPGYRFEVGRDPVRGLPFRVTWLIGRPIAEA